MRSGLRRLYSTRTPTPETILKSALKLVPQHGWESALIETTRKKGLSDQVTSIIQPFHLVEYFYKSEALKLSHHKFEDVNLSIYKTLEDLLYSRLESNRTLGIDNLQDAMRIALNFDKRAPLQLVTDTADEMCFVAGDRSTDLRWYSRRSAVTAAYMACEAVQTKDLSDDSGASKLLAKKAIDLLQDCESTEDGLYSFFKYHINGVFNVGRTLI